MISGVDSERLCGIRVFEILDFTVIRELTRTMLFCVETVLVTPKRKAVGSNPARDAKNRQAPDWACRFFFLCSENHSLGEWFEKRLMSIMME